MLHRSPSGTCNLLSQIPILINCLQIIKLLRDNVTGLMYTAKAGSPSLSVGRWSNLLGYPKVIKLIGRAGPVTVQEPHWSFFKQCPCHLRAIEHRWSGRWPKEKEAFSCRGLEWASGFLLKMAPFGDHSLCFAAWLLPSSLWVSTAGRCMMVGKPCLLSTWGWLGFVLVWLWFWSVPFSMSTKSWLILSTNSLGSQDS